MTSPKPLKRIIFINRVFYPDQSATSQMLSDLAFALVEKGFAITVIASGPRCRGLSLGTETIKGVEVLRVATAEFHSSNLIPRVVEYLRFYFAASWLLFYKVKREDILVAKTDPPMISFFAALVARLKGARLVNWLQDLYPEVAYELGVPLTGGAIGWGLKRARGFALRSASVNVAIGRQMAELLGKRCGVGSQIEIIPNWADDRKIRPLSRTDNEFLKEIARNGEFVVGYSGNLGRAHEFETLLGAARLLAHNEDVVFAFIGGGYHIKALKNRVETEGLEKQFRFLPMQPLEKLEFSLPAPNVHWISLRPKLEGLVLPSKYYGVLAAGRPTIAIMDKNGEISCDLEHYGCGIVIEPGDSTTLAREILRLKNDDAACALMGRRARGLLEWKYRREKAINRWTELLRRL